MVRLAVLAALALGGCAGPRTHYTHGSPWHLHQCDGGATLQMRQMLEGDAFEVRAGGRTALVEADASGDRYVGRGGVRLTRGARGFTVLGLPGGPHTGCVVADMG